MTDTSLPYIYLDENAYGLTATNLATMLGKRPVDVIQEAMLLFSEGSSFSKLFNQVTTPGARGIVGTLSTYPGPRGLSELFLEKDYALYLLKKYGLEGSPVYDFVTDNLKEPPHVPGGIVDNLESGLLAKDSIDRAVAPKMVTVTVNRYIDLNDIQEVAAAIADECRSRNYDSAAFSLTEPRPDFGHIYVLEHRNTDRVKIGRSVNPKDRLAALHTQGGGHARRFIGDRVRNHKSLELAIHCVLDSKRDVGEWFRVSFEYAVSVVSAASAKFSDKDDESDMSDFF